jgi:hypothetical protein
MAFTEAIRPYDFDPQQIEKALDDNPNCLFVVLVMSDEAKLIQRLQNRAKDGLIVDEYDKNCVLYNRRYQEITRQFRQDSRIRSFDASSMSKFEKIATVYEFYLTAKYPDEQPFSV